MANIKITELNAASSLAATDVVPVVDVSADETKKITATDLFRTLPDGTAAAPALAFSSDQANGVYLAGTDTVGISTGGTQRVTVDGSGNVSISGDLTVSGTTTTVESTTVTIDDKNIELGFVATPTDTTADGGGITLKGATDKTLKWINSTGCWTFNQPMNFNDHVRIDSSGRVGIGTTSPNKPLHIYSGSSDAEIRLQTNSGTEQNSYITLRQSSGDLDFYTVASGTNMKFHTVNTERLRIDSSGNVGIGTSNLNTNTVLSVHKGDSSESQMRFTNSTTGEAGNNGFLVGIDSSEGGRLFVQENNYLRFGTNNSERLRIDSSGRLLVGTSSSRNSSAGFQLEAAGSVGNEAGRSMFLTYNAGAQSRSGFLTFAKTRGIAVGQNTAVASGDGLGEINFAGADGSSLITGASIGVAVDGTPGSNDMPGRLVFSTTADGASSPTERMRIDKSGRVGIGNTIPGTFSILEANNLVVGSGSGTEGITVYSGSSNTGRIAFADGTTGNAQYRGIFDYKHSSDAMTFSTAAAERLRIDTTGRVGIGTSAPNYKLQVAGTDPTLAINATNHSSSSVSTLLYRNADGNGNTRNVCSIEGESTGNGGYGALAFHTAFDNSLLERARIDQSGRLMLGTTTEGHASADDFTIADSGDVGITLRSTDSSQTQISFSDGTSGTAEYAGQIAYDHSDDHMRFRTAATERLRINSNGAWGIEGASNYGTSGQVLTSNGNDAPTWQDASGGGGATGGGSDQWVVETDQTVTTSYELTAGKHGTTVSPTINSGATITVPSGAILVIL